MLKINVKSFQEGIKELGKFKSKEYFINLVNEGHNIYLTKTCLNDLNEVITYRLDGEVESNAHNYELMDTSLKAITKIKEGYIDVLSGDEDHIRLVTTKRNIDCLIGSYKFNTDLLNFESIEQFPMSSEKMKVLLQVTDYAAQDETKPILQGVNFKGNKVCCLDGYRLAVREFNNMNLENSYTLHSSILNNISSLLKKDSSTSIAFNEKQCRIQIDKLTITSDLLEGAFIKYESIIPREFKVKAEFNQKELKEEIEFLMSLSEIKDSLVKFGISTEKVELNSLGQKNSVTINLEKASSDGELSIAFNQKFIYDMLKHFNEKVVCKLVSPISPMTCTSEEVDGLDLILPIRICK